MNKKINIIKYILVIILFSSITYSQEVQSPTLSFNRGKLWQSVFNGKIAPPFNNWRRTGIGLDWPGFDPNWVNMSLGGAPSYMLSGGFIVGCKKSEDSVLAVDDWALSGGTIATDNGAKYVIKKHKKTFNDKDNFWLASDPNKGEEVIETSWEYNPIYSDVYGVWHQMPIRVNRIAHQWSGSKRDENYIIYEYTFKNISNEVKAALIASGDTARLKTIPDTLSGFYAMLSYAMHCNSRAWSVNFPQETPGAKNTLFIWDPANKMMWGKASDYKNTATIEKDFGFSYSQGIVLSKGTGGEYLAPGYVGLKLLYASPNDSGKATYVKEYGWSAGDNSYDFGGPVQGKNTVQAEYDIFKNIANANSFVKTSSDSLMQRSRMWSLMTLGPWNLKPGDSIKIAVAEIVDGMDYKYAVDSSAATYSLLGPQGYKIFLSSAKKAQFTYDNKFRHPNPPAAPDFTVDYYRDRERFVANQITWKDTYDDYHDPLDPSGSLVGYKVYRSSYLPIGPWDSVGVVYKKSPINYNTSSGIYTFVDSTVVVGASYYYSLTAFDTLRGAWAVNPSASFEETGTSHKVPGLESSIYANKKITKFTSTIPAAKNLSDVVVVPNPFVLGKGRTQPGDGDIIQFYNIPNPCTIRIYTIRGDLLKTIKVPEGNGAIASWNQVTDYGLFVKSGLYIYHIDSGSETKIGKFSIIR